MPTECLLLPPLLLMLPLLLLPPPPPPLLMPALGARFAFVLAPAALS